MHLSTDKAYMYPKKNATRAIVPKINIHLLAMCHVRFIYMLIWTHLT